MLAAQFGHSAEQIQGGACMKVCFNPHYPGNPYQHIVAEALAAHGVHVQYGITMPHHLLHIHWQDRWLGRALPAGPKVFTCHNLLPHSGGSMRAMRTFLEQMDAVICHTEYMQVKLKDLFGVEAVVIAHPHYRGFYPDRVDKTQATAKLGLGSDNEVWLHFGAIKPYKRVDKLMQQFSELPGEHRRLLVAGHIHRVDQRKLQAIADKDSRIKLLPGFVSDDEVQYLLRAADVQVLAYDNITTSGSAMLGLSFGLQIVAPDLPEMKAQVPQGLFYKKHLKEVIPELEQGRTNITLNSAHSPDSIGRQTAQVYKKVMEAYR